MQRAYFGEARSGWVPRSPPGAYGATLPGDGEEDELNLLSPRLP